MAKLTSRVSPAGPQTLKMEDIKTGDVVLVGPGRAPMMKVSHDWQAENKTGSHLFVALEDTAHMKVGEIVPISGSQFVFYPVLSAEITIRR